MRCLLFISFLSVCVSCNYFQSKQQETDSILAEAEGKTLHLSEIKNIFPAGITRKDSLELLKNYIYNWTYKCVMAAKAEQVLDKQQRNVEKELDDYRMSLLAYRYEMFCLHRDLDTLVNNDDLLACYQQDFPPPPVTSPPTAKVVYIKMRQTAVTELNMLRQALSDNKGRSFIDSLCVAINVQPDYIGNLWLSMDEIADLFPFSGEQCSVAIRNNKSMIEEKRGGYVYFLGLREVRGRPYYPPMAQLREQYYTTIINQRRMDLLKKIETDVYNKALDNQHVKIYVNE